MVAVSSLLMAWNVRFFHIRDSFIGHVVSVNILQFSYKYLLLLLGVKIVVLTLTALWACSEGDKVMIYFLFAQKTDLWKRKKSISMCRLL